MMVALAARGDRRRRLSILGTAALAFAATGSRADDAPGVSGWRDVQITVTRLPEAVRNVPESMTVLSGSELRDRGATDLRSALAGVAGVDAPAGGDAGPAGAVPSFWGLHEFDAFLLVVDGIPWGGAFNPALATLDLNDVERIEILKGAAPVMYGATSFVGVIHVVRYAAGESAGEARVAARNRGGGVADLSTALPAIGDYRQSLAFDTDRNRLTGRDQGVDRVHGLYRAAAPLGPGSATMDAEYTVQRQDPTSPVVRTDAGLTTLTPLDANFNPADAGIVEHRARLSFGYRVPLGDGEWRTRLSYTRSSVHDVRGFVRPELAVGDDGNNADGFNQDRTIDDAWFDSYVALPLAKSVSLTAGVDWLYGRGTQQSLNFAYVAALDGSAVPPASGSRHVDEINGLDDRRSFGGLYAQLSWAASDRVTVLGGLRLNRTDERQVSSHIDTYDPTNDLYAVDSRTATRLSGAAGLTALLWGGTPQTGEARLFANYRNTFKPAAIDFGPDVNPDILKPESADGFEAGLRGVAPGGRLEWEVALFSLDFRNLVVHTTDASGAPVLANAGQERFRGAEAELRWRPRGDLLVTAAYSYHDTRFGNTLATEGDATVQLDGRQLELSPHGLASAGLLYAPASGVRGGVQLAYIGRRFLDRLNTTPVGGYTTVDAEAGYRLGRYTLRLVGRNLTDRRDPVTGSEFGDESFYLMPARQLELSLTVSLAP
ncbi:MAG: TonB-dependent receptor [Proteobacteria bacterium]|nr:TonB-dependent receptor [Pseudomonadota bacterium]